MTLWQRSRANKLDGRNILSIECLNRAHYRIRWLHIYDGAIENLRLQHPAIIIPMMTAEFEAYMRVFDREVDVVFAPTLSLPSSPQAQRPTASALIICEARQVPDMVMLAM